jgi:putative nucleotidyltransferase with HDIG domain
MKFEATFLSSNLGRRVFGLFIACALLPITVLAVVSLRNVSAQINENSRVELRHASRDEAMLIYEHLSFVEQELKLFGTSIQTQAVGSEASRARNFDSFSRMRDRILGIDLVDEAGLHQSVFGTVVPSITLSDDQRAFLLTGKSLLSTARCSQQGACVLLAQQLNTSRPHDGFLLALIEPSHLWDKASLPADLSACVLDDSGNRLFCSDERPDSFPAEVTHNFSGAFQWRSSGRVFDANYWNLPLQSSFHTSHWTVIASKAEVDVLAPLAKFKMSFILAYLLALWIVLLLSSVQIRRSLIPLEQLKDGTRKVARGDYKVDVNIKSGDEFQELAESFNAMAGRIEKQINSQKMVNQIDRAILSSLELEKIIDTLASHFDEIFVVDALSVTILDNNVALKGETYIYGRRADLLKDRVTVDLVGEELQQIPRQQTIPDSAAKGCASYLKPLAAREMTSFLIVPIRVEQKLAAILTLCRKQAVPWLEEETNQADDIGDQLAVALSNAQLVTQMQQLQWGTLTALARAIDAKSPWTMGHSERVTEYALHLATEMALPAKDFDILRRGGLLHDVGKIGIPVSILDKKGPLTDEEMRIMREHVNIGARILEPIPGLAESMPIVLQHHEWINGGGYPNRLSGDQVTLHARIFAIADCFDALTSDRPYRAGMSMDRALGIIQAGSGSQFDPKIVDVLVKIVAPILTSKEVAEQPSETTRRVELETSP